MARKKKREKQQRDYLEAIYPGSGSVNRITPAMEDISQIDMAKVNQSIMKMNQALTNISKTYLNTNNTLGNIFPNVPVTATGTISNSIYTWRIPATYDLDSITMECTRIDMQVWQRWAVLRDDRERFDRWLEQNLGEHHGVCEVTLLRDQNFRCKRWCKDSNGRVLPGPKGGPMEEEVMIYTRGMHTVEGPPTWPPPECFGVGTTPRYSVGPSKWVTSREYLKMTKEHGHDK